MRVHWGGGERERQRQTHRQTEEKRLLLSLSLSPPLSIFPSLLLSFPLESNQSKIVECGVLEVLVPLLDSRESEIVTAAIAALRNLSIKKGNEVSGSQTSISSV